MVGLVLILRDNMLTEALSGALKRATTEELPLACIGGNIDTDIITKAVHSVYSTDGVLILIDDNNFVSTVTHAIEGLATEYQNVRLCPAPIFEGAAAAFITAGAELEQVYFEALKSISPKLSTTETTVKYDSGGVSSLAAEGTIASYRFIMSNPLGLTSGYAAEFQNSIAHLDAKVSLANLTKHKAPVNARSGNRLAVANIEYGDEIEVVARGGDALLVVDEVKKLAETVFNAGFTGSNEEKYTQTATTLSVGLCTGTLFRADSMMQDIQPLCVLDPDDEVNRLHKAIEETKNELLKSKNSLIERGFKDEAMIFDAQIMLLEDSEIIDNVRKQVLNQRINAAYLYQQKMLALADAFRSISDVYVRERATDLMDVAGQVLVNLTGVGRVNLEELDSVIIAASEVTPSMIGRCRPEQLKGIITDIGSPFSHVAILARALGIPAIGGFRLPANVSTGNKVILDTSTMDIIFNPDENKLAEFEKRYTEWQIQIRRNLEDGEGSAVTKDGTEIPIYGNVGDVATAEAVLKNGAEGIGLLRTEFLYLNSRTMPSEKEQIQVLKDIFRLFKSRPIYVRTIDIGGDKYIPWLPLKKENNPFMGVRGVRLYPKEYALFYTQLRSILTAGKNCDIKIMIPMISVIDELIFAKTALENAHKELESESIEHAWPVEIGMMVETPSAVLMADELAKLSDFFSIGTNDLGQYIMAAERGERGVEYLLNPMQPALLKAISMTVDAAKRNNIRVSVCGEMAGDPESAKILLGLGIHCLSMNAQSIGRIKRTVRSADMSKLKEASQKALQNAPTATNML